MNVILDTNMFISGVFFSGPPYRILEAWRDEKIRLIVSLEILEEYRRVGEILAKDHPGINLSPWIELVIQKASIFSVQPLAEVVCDDPDDDKFLACALASESMILNWPIKEYNQPSYASPNTKCRRRSGLKPGR